MSTCELDPETMPRLSTEEAHTLVGTALALLELAGQLLEKAPPPETALPFGDRKLYRYLQAAETARLLLVGQEPGDCLDRPGTDSALGAGQRIYEWSEEQAERHFESAVREWSERQ